MRIHIQQRVEDIRPDPRIAKTNYDEQENLYKVLDSFRRQIEKLEERIEELEASNYICNK